MPVTPPATPTTPWSFHDLHRLTLHLLASRPPVHELQMSFLARWTTWKPSRKGAPHPSGSAFWASQVHRSSNSQLYYLFHVHSTLHPQVSSIATRIFFEGIQEWFSKDLLAVSEKANHHPFYIVSLPWRQPPRVFPRTHGNAWTTLAYTLP